MAGIVKLLLVLFKFAKIGKLLATGGTMLLTVVLYAFVFGWPYAVGFVLLIFCHEMGHYVAARQRGLGAGLPMFIPFVGAWVEMKDAPQDVETEAYVGIAGPVAGTLAALACYYLAKNYDSRLMLALSYSGFLINLINLIPVMPLDGGRITAILSPRVWFIGAPILVAFYFYHPSVLILFVVALSIPQLIAAWKYDPKDPAHAAYYQTSLQNRITYTVFYLGLVAFLGMMSQDVHDMLGDVRLHSGWS